MTRVLWDAPGDRIYQAGVDRGMLYVTNGPVVPWNGLVSVGQSEVNAAAQPFYLDGQKVLNVAGGADVQLTLDAFAYPVEFMGCTGRIQLAAGLFATDQPRQTFGLSYRTMLGNDTEGVSLGYKLHVVFNALAALSDFQNDTLSDTVTAKSYSWTITAVPVSVAGFRPTAHVVIDSRYVSSDALILAENILYGDVEGSARLPTTDELVSIMTG